jgi:predicted secreted protein
MSNHKGSEGSVKVGSNAVAELKGWSLTESANTIDDSTLTDTWMTKKAGQQSWNGKADAFWDETDTTGQGAMTIGAEVTLNMYPEGSGAGATYFTGSAIITGIERSAAIDGMVETSFSFEGNGILTETTV